MGLKDELMNLEKIENFNKPEQVVFRKRNLA